MKTIYKIKRIERIVIVLLIIMLSGCSTIYAYQEIKSDPEVMDFKINQIEETIICTIYLKYEIPLEEITLKTNRIKNIIREIDDKSDIIVRFMQKDFGNSTY